jgi:hypothetical protein
LDKQYLLGHELAGTTPAFFCARNNSALYQHVLQIVVQNDKKERNIARKINHKW